MVWLAWITAAMAADLTFVVVGDTQGSGTDASINWDTLPQLVEDMNAHSPDVALFAGGLVAGSETLDTHVLQWEDFKTATEAFTGELMVLPGTSDLTPGEGVFDAWRESFNTLPVDDSPAGEEGISYYRDFGSVRLVGVSSDQFEDNRYEVSEAGLEWLDRVLSESDSFEHVFVMTHHPVSFSAYPSSYLETDGGLGHTGSAFWQTLLRHDVTSLFAGHWNRYQAAPLGNGGSTWEIIVGTGGGQQNAAAVRPYQERVGYLLVEVTGEEVVSTFYGDEDEDGRYDNPLQSVLIKTATEPPTGLVSRYTFDDGTANDSAPESTGFGLDGQLVNSAEIIDEGASGAALQVLGDGDFVEVGDIDDHRLGILGDLSISMWVNMPALNTGAWDNVLLAYATEDLYREDEQSNYAYYWNVLSDGRLKVFWEYEDGHNVSVVSSSPTSIHYGGWHHVGFVRDDTRKRLEFYSDGEPLGVAGTFVRAPTGASRGMLYLGADIAGSYDSGSGAGEWFWSDGSEVTYTAWAAGEPNDSGGNQDCGVMHWGGSVDADWDDLSCEASRPFICRGTEVVVEPVDTGLVEGSEVVCEQVDHEGSVTLFCTTSRTWSEARDECRSQGLDLVSIHSAEEQTWLYEQAEAVSPSANWFMGLRERESAGSYDEICIYNQLLDAGEMERLGSKEDCVTVLEPLPPEPEDTGASDTGSEDTGATSDEGGSSTADEEGLDGADTAEEPVASSAKSGCACASTGGHQTRWPWFMILAVLLGIRRSNGVAL